MAALSRALSLTSEWGERMDDLWRRAMPIFSGCSLDARDGEKRAPSTHCARLLLLRLDVGCPDHLGPLFGILGDHLAELVGHHRHWSATHVLEPRLDLRIGKARVDLFIEFVDDVGRRAFWRAHAEPQVHLVAWEKLAYGRDVRQRAQARRRGDRQCAQLTGPDERDRRGSRGEYDFHLRRARL